MSDVAVFAGVKLGPGTLYTAITRLVERTRLHRNRATGVSVLPLTARARHYSPISSKRCDALRPSV